MAKRRKPPVGTAWAPRLDTKGRKQLSKKRKANGTRKFSRYTLPKAHRGGPHTSGFEITPKPGRPPYQPTDGDRAFIAKLSSYGMTVEQTCSLIEARYGECVSPDTLYKYFGLEIRVGTPELVAWAADKIVSHARRDSLAAAIFIAKTRGRWAAQTNIADANGNVMTPPNVLVVFGAEEEEEIEGDTPPEGTEE